MKALRKMTWIELKLFLRDPLSVLFTLALPFFFLVVLNGVFGNEVAVEPEEDVWRGVGPSDYYVPAYLGLVMAAIGVLSMPVRLANYRERGVLRRFRASAMPLWAILGAQIAIALLTAVVGAVSIAVASTLIYGTELLPADGLLFIPAYALASLAFAALGVFLGSVLPTSRSAQGAGIMLFFVMFLLSGCGPPRDVLSGPMRAVGDAFPLAWVIRLLQDPWLGFGWAGTASLVVAGVLVGSVALSVRFFRWD
jgi:ABC-2 type transport system permease protein